MSLLASPIGRDPDFNQEALEDFQNVVRAEGLNAENIFIPKQSGRKQADMFFHPHAGKAQVTQDKRLPLIQLCPLGVGKCWLMEGPWVSGRIPWDFGIMCLCCYFSFFFLGQKAAFQETIKVSDPVSWYT